MKQAVIDIGSNSMRLSVYETTETGAFTILFKDKIMAGLAGYVEEGALSPEGITRGHPGSAVLPGHLACPEHPPGWRCLPRPPCETSETPPRQWRRSSGAPALPLRFSPGRRRPAWATPGAMEELALSEGLFVDIGGASTEVVRFAHSQLVSAVSCPVGSLKLYRDWVKKILPNQQAVESMKKAIRQATRGW